MRHPKEGAPRMASHYIKMPLINAGDGGHQHPTQTLTDILTIERLRGGVENKTYGFCGDLKFGRTVHSLVKFLSNYEGVKFIFISPEELRVPEYIREEVVKKKGIPFMEVDQMEPYMGQLDFLYMTRVQRERFFNEEDYIRLKDRFILDPEKDDLRSPRYLYSSPTSTCERNQPRSRQRPARSVLQPGQERYVCPYGPYLQTFRNLLKF